VGRVECFELAGLDMRFPANDHLPYHFHVTRPGEWMIKVVILRSSRKHGLFHEIVWSRTGRGPTAAEIDNLLENVVLHRRRLLREWDQKVRPQQ
jgi:hypothetical protein